MLHSLLVLHYTDVVASVAVQKAPKKGTIEFLRFWSTKWSKKEVLKWTCRNVPLGLRSINKQEGMRISIGITHHVLEVPYYQNYHEYLHSKKNWISNHRYYTQTSFCINRSNQRKAGFHSVFCWLALQCLQHCVNYFCNLCGLWPRWNIKPRLYCLAQWYLSDLDYQANY